MPEALLRYEFGRDGRRADMGERVGSARDNGETLAGMKPLSLVTKWFIGAGNVSRNFMKLLIYFVLIAFWGLLSAEARLSVRIDEPKQTGEKSVIKATFKNTFGERVESARATLFLLDEQGKPVEQITRWVIGGTKDQPSLAAGASTTYNFVVTTQKPFAATKLIFSRIVLEGGKLADPAKDFVLER